MVQPTTVRWRDLTFATGSDATYRILGIDGWEGTPPPRYDKINRSRGHGSHPSDVWADERLVTVEGQSWSEANRDDVLQALMARMTLGSGPEDLTISLGGRTLSAAAQFLRADPVLNRDEWGIGRFGWVAQWRCPDPLRYGPELAADPIGLPTSGGGLSYSLSYPLTYGASPVTGQIDLFNAGTAPAPVQFAVTGPLPGGFELSTTDGQRIVFEGPVPAGQVITIDTATGMVLAEGTADRRGYITQADWIQVPAGGSTTVNFASLAGYDPAASLSVLRFRAAYW